MSKTFSVDLTQDQIEQFLYLAKTIKNTFEHVVPTEYQEKSKLVKFFSKVKSYDDMLQTVSKYEHRLNEQVFNAYAEFFFRKCAFKDFVYVGPAGDKNVGSSIDAELQSEDGSQVLVYCHPVFDVEETLAKSIAASGDAGGWHAFYMFGQGIPEDEVGQIIFNAKAAGIPPQNRIIFTPLLAENITFVNRPPYNDGREVVMKGAEEHVRVFAREEQLAILEKYPTFWEDLTTDLIDKL